MCPAIDAVVGGVDAALGEPGDIAVLEAPAAHGLEVAVPVQQLAGGLSAQQQSSQSQVVVFRSNQVMGIDLFYSGTEIGSAWESSPAPHRTTPLNEERGSDR